MCLMVHKTHTENMLVSDLMTKKKTGTLDSDKDTVTCDNMLLTLNSCSLPISIKTTTHVSSV